MHLSEQESQIYLPHYVQLVQSWLSESSVQDRCKNLLDPVSVIELPVQSPRQCFSAILKVYANTVHLRHRLIDNLTFWEKDFRK